MPERPDALLFIATDRLSAFDVVMKTGIPGKGRILNQLSLFWFDMFERAGLGPHHLITGDVEQMPASVRAHADAVRGRCMLVRRLEMLPVEAIVRGYITGSGWKEYTQRGTICDIALPRGLAECERLPPPHFPLFTPSTKADVGIHDENVSTGSGGRINFPHSAIESPLEFICDLLFASDYHLRANLTARQISPAKAALLLGEARAATVQQQAFAYYQLARDFAATKGVIIADTKFEFGVDAAGAVHIADEVLTPDSSRFWPAATYAAGRAQDSFDKQFVRDYLESIAYDKATPVELPADVVAKTLAKYIEIFQILTGRAPEL